MKRVVSVSLGSSKRDAKTCVNISGQQCLLERIGTDGDKPRAMALFAELRDQVDAFGLGGTDLYIYAGKRRYTFRESEKFIRAAGVVPVFDGSGLKNYLERKVLQYLKETDIVDFRNKKVLLMCGVDRAGMAAELSAYGCDIVFGDLMFGLSLPLPIRSLGVLHSLARVLAPIVTKMPIHYFYPIGVSQEERRPKFINYFRDADIIAGDFHFIRKFMPDELDGKIIITNTVTAGDKEILKAAKVKLLVTTTPDFAGRSFGTNLWEAALYTICGREINKESFYGDIGEYAVVNPGIFYF